MDWDYRYDRSHSNETNQKSRVCNTVNNEPRQLAEHVRTKECQIGEKIKEKSANAVPY